MIVKIYWEVMAKQAKPSSEAKLKAYLRRKYMMSEHAHDRIADHEDWRDGMNQFRLKTREELIEVNNKLDIIIKALNGQTEKSQN